MSSFVVLVTGSRNFTAWTLLKRTLDDIHWSRDDRPITRIVHGAMSGADALASRWAHERRVDIVAYGAQWGTYGNAAGPIRNNLMLDAEQPDLVVAFPLGRSNGTRGCITQALARTIPVQVIE